MGMIFTFVCAKKYTDAPTYRKKGVPRINKTVKPVTERLIIPIGDSELGKSRVAPVINEIVMYLAKYILRG